VTTLITAALSWLSEKMPLWVWALLAGGLLVGAAYIAGNNHGAAKVQAQWDKAAAVATLAAAKQETEQAKVTTELLTHYTDRVKVVHDHGAALIKEVPVYVSNTDCSLSGGFRLLHDAAARGEVPNPAGIAHAPTVAAADFAATVIENYSRYRALAEQLMALQEWVRRQESLAK
jgi:hypothetical protein